MKKQIHVHSLNHSPRVSDEPGIVLCAETTTFSKLKVSPVAKGYIL